jgi:hypothetical protein
MHGEVVSGIDKIRLETHGLFVVSDRIGHPSGHLRQDVGEVMVRLGGVRLEAHGGFAVHDGVGQPTGYFRQGHGEVVVSFEGIGLKAHRRFVVRMASASRPGIFASAVPRLLCALAKSGLSRSASSNCAIGVGQPAGHLRQGQAEVVVRTGKVGGV